MSDSFISTIVKEKEDVIGMLASLKNRQSKKIEDRIITRKIRGHVRFYLHTKDGKIKYIKRENQEVVSRFKQYQYDEAVKKTLETKLLLLEKIEAEYSSHQLEDMYSLYSFDDKISIKPVKTTDKVFVEKWLKQNHTDPSMTKGEYETNSGIFVRSKTEKIIADELFNKGLIFVYENQVKLGNGVVVRPDFCILDIKNRKTIIWEHFGMLNDVEYVRGTYRKMAGYFESGCICGDTFIYSTEGTSLDITKQIKSNIDWLVNGGKWKHVPIC